MNEQAIITRLREAYPIADGSTPAEMTPVQQRARNIAGRLLIHAHKRGKRKKGRWM